MNGFDFFPIQNFYCNFVPGEHVFGHFDFTERPYPERFPYAIVWEVYLRGRRFLNVVVVVERGVPRERENPDESERDIFQLGKKQFARANICCESERKKKKRECLRRTSAALPRSSSFLSPARGVSAIFFFFFFFFFFFCFVSGFQRVGVLLLLLVPV